MRTTLTLEPDVALRLKRRVQLRKISLKEAVNQALRAGLKVTEEPPPPQFKVEPFACGLKPGIDPDKLNQLLDELEVEAFREKMLRDHPGR
jgi:hypothetical protein